MTQEEKQLLLKDLCSRLPYGVNLHIEFYDLQGDGELASRDVKLTDGNICYCFDNSHWVNFKPYLRPMSIMTEEERSELKSVTCPNGTGYFHEQYLVCPVNHFGEQISFGFMSEIIDWLDKHHFDYRRLIEKGLALEAPEGMYKTE